MRLKLPSAEISLTLLANDEEETQKLAFPTCLYLRQVVRHSNELIEAVDINSKRGRDL